MKNSVRMTVVVALAFIIGCGPKVQLTVQRPSEVNMTGYPRIAVGEIKGRDGDKLFNDLFKAITKKSPEFDVVDGSTLAFVAMTLAADSTAKTAMITGTVLVRDKDEDLDKTTFKKKDKETGEQKTSVKYTRKGSADFTVEFHISDMHTGQRLISKTIYATRTDSETATNKMPDAINFTQLFASCRQAVVRDFMKVIIPYAEKINVSFEDDDKIPP